MKVAQAKRKRDVFVLARHVARGAWSGASSEAECARCHHSMAGHGERGVGRCRGSRCSCSAFALWKGMPMSYLVKRFERELLRHGEAGAAALALWGKRRPSGEAGVVDATPAGRRELACELVKVAASVDVASVVSLALVQLFAESEGAPSFELKWVPMMGPGCVAAEAFRGVWHLGSAAVPPCVCEEEHDDA